MHSLRPIASHAGPLGVHINGPSLGPSCAGAFALGFGSCGTGRRQGVITSILTRGAVGDVAGRIACSDRSNIQAAAPLGLGNG